jgi:hypothetical protein
MEKVARYNAGTMPYLEIADLSQERSMICVERG